MKLYQTEVVTVKGIAISVTAGFILDVHKSFMLLDEVMLELYQQNVLGVVIDKNDVTDVMYKKHRQYIMCASETVSAWNVMYKLLKTTDNTFTSEFVEFVKSQEQETEAQPVL